MPFCVVQTRKSKKSKPVLTIVPSKWVSSGNVYWPLSNFVTLSADGNSEPDSSWRIQQCKVVGRAGSYKSAEETVRKLENLTDSEDEAQTSLGTRAHPGKKPVKFQSKIYQLAPPRSDSAKKSVSSKKNKHCRVTDAPTDQLIESSRIGNDDQLLQPSCSYRLPPTSGISSYTVTSPSPTFVASQHKMESPLAPIELQSTSISNETNAPEFSSGRRAETEQHTIDDQQLHQQVITIADGIPAQTEQQDQDQANEIGITMSGPLQVFRSPLGRQYVHLQNGCFLEVMAEQSNPEPEPENHIETNMNTEPNDDQSITLKGIDERLTRIDERLTRIEACLQKVVMFMADVAKFMEIRKEPSMTAPPVKKRRENFEEISTLFPINDHEALLSLENGLNNQVFVEKLSRYVSCQYELNGKRDEKAFFKILIRKMLAPNVLLPYSWMGNSRKISDDREANKGFKKSFINIVKFFETVTCEADCTFSVERVHKAFSDHLRQKNTEMKRFLTGGDRRMPSSRVRPRKVKATEKDENTDENTDENVDDNQDQDNSEVETNSKSNDSENFEDFMDTAK